MAKQKKISALPKEYQQTGRNRVVIENVQPAVDEGKYPVKRVQREWLTVEADIFADGHDKVSGILMFRKTRGERKLAGSADGKDTANDRWAGAFELTETGAWEFTVRGFVDHPISWLYDFRKRVGSNDVAELALQLQIGIQLLEKIGKHYPERKKGNQRMDRKI